MARRRASRESLTPFLPRLSVAWTAEMPGVRQRTLEGSLVFADISGFTALSERLARRGPVGAEELTDVLGACFSELLAIAYARGGGLLKFGGDALLLLFDDADGSDHACRAVAAAMEMRTAIRTVGRLSTSVGNVRLRMSQGVHTGELEFYRVGRTHRELLVAGEGATAVVAMESLADAGEIVVSGGTAAALDASLLGDSKGAGMLIRNRAASAAVCSTPVIAPIPPQPAASEGIPIALREYLLAGGGDSDHRHVGVAFVHFDLARDDQDPVDALDAFIADVQCACEREGVTFLATDVDRDGGKVILVAGAPDAVEDADGRLLRAVRSIADTANPRLPVRIGVNHGHVFAGVIGPPYRRTYTVMGDAVNLAARLMAKAQPGEIVVSPAALARSRTLFETEALEPFLVKGKSEPVHAMTLGAATGSQEVRESARLPIVGRDSELASLREAVAKGGHVEIVGGVGLGKTRLLEELRDMATVAYLVSCEQYQSSTPYFAFRVLLQRVLGGVGNADELAARVPYVNHWMPLLGAVLGVPVPENDATARLDPQFRRQRTARVVREVLETELSSHAVLGLDDVQWLDDASADLLVQLGHAVWLVATARRDERTDATPAASERNVILLPPLEDEAMRALLALATSAHPLPPHRQADLLARAGGNPLFLEELVKVTSAAGASADAGLPESLEAVAAARIDQLAPADRRALRQASVLGASFDAELLAEVAGDGSLRRFDGLLERARGGRVQFRHRLMRDVAYSMLPFRERRELHGRAADALQARAGEAEEEVLSLHSFHAQRFDACWSYATVAGQRAWKSFALVEACELYERALAAARHLRVDDDELAEVWNSLAKVRQLAGRFDAADAAYATVRRLRSDDPVAVAAICGRHAQVAQRRGRPLGAARWIGRGLRQLDGRTDPPAAAERAHLHTMYANLRYNAGAPRDALRWCHAAIEEATRGENPRALAEAYALTDWAELALGRPDRAVNAERALAIYEEIGERDTVALMLNNLGAAAYFNGDWTKALGLYERARVSFEEIGNVVDAALGSCNIAEIFADQGRLDEAESVLNDAIDTWRAFDFDVGIPFATRHLGRVALRRGDVDLALERFRSARASFDTFGLVPKVVEVDAWIAECLLARGDVDAARDVLASALAAEVSSGRLEMRPMIHRLRACAAAMDDRFDDAWAEIDESLHIARSRGIAFDVALGLEVLAALAEHGGRPQVEGAREERDALISSLGILAMPAVPLMR